MPTFSRPVTSRRYTQRFTTAFSGGGLAAAYNCVTNAILPTRGSLWAAGVLKGLIARPSGMSSGARSINVNSVVEDPRRGIAAALPIGDNAPREVVARGKCRLRQPQPAAQCA